MNTNGGPVVLCLWHKIYKRTTIVSLRSPCHLRNTVQNHCPKLLVSYRFIVKLIVVVRHNVHGGGTLYYYKRHTTYMKLIGVPRQILAGRAPLLTDTMHTYIRLYGFT